MAESDEFIIVSGGNCSGCGKEAVRALSFPLDSRMHTKRYGELCKECIDKMHILMAEGSEVK